MEMSSLWKHMNDTLVRSWWRSNETRG